MKKATKGALAAAAAGTMLVGGYGSLATWTSQKTINGGTINSGTLSLSDPTCDGTVAGTHEWQYAADDSAFSFSDKIVPGEVITKVCRVTLTGEGKNLSASLTLAGASITDDANAATTLDSVLDASATFKVDGVDKTSPVALTSANFASSSTKQVLVTISVTFPSTVTNTDSQGMAAALTNLTITADQT